MLTALYSYHSPQNDSNFQLQSCKAELNNLRETLESTEKNLENEKESNRQLQISLGNLKTKLKDIHLTAAVF
jgi:hypothetical protein